MDEPTKEKIARIIASTHSTFDERWAPATADEFYNEAEEVLKALGELGYRKLEGKPPLLSDARHIFDKAGKDYADNIDATDFAGQEEAGQKAIAKAQRDSDIKWYGGKE